MFNYSLLKITHLITHYSKLLISQKDDNKNPAGIPDPISA